MGTKGHTPILSSAYTTMRRAWMQHVDVARARTHDEFYTSPRALGTTSGAVWILKWDSEDGERERGQG